MRSFFLPLAAALLISAPAALAQTNSAHPYGPSSLSLSNGVAKAALSIDQGAYAYRQKLGLLADGEPLAGLSAPAGRAIEDPLFGSVEALEGDFEMSAPAPVSAQRIQSVDQVCSSAQGVCYPARAIELDVASGSIRELGIAQSAKLAALLESSRSPQPASPPAELSWRSRPAPAPAPPPADSAQPSKAGANGLPLASADYFSSALSGSAWSALAIFFCAGVLLSMTPCNWPLLPLLARQLSSNGAERFSARRKAAMVFSYACAFGLVYAALGALAAAAGSIASAAIASSAGTALIASLLAAMGLSSLGLFELSLPSFARSWGAQGGASNQRPLLAAAGSGVFGALLASPCVAAPLAGALLFSAASGSIAWSAVALFCMALGLCAPLAAMALLGSRWLPKSGPWMVAIRQLIGWILLLLAARWASPLMPGPLALALCGLALMGMGAFLALGAIAPGSEGPGRSARLALGASLAVWSACQLAGAASGASDPLAPLARWGSSAGTEPQAFAFDNAARVGSVEQLEALWRESEKDQRPVALLATADWCANCKTLERATLRRTPEQLSLDGVRLAVADFSHLGPEQERLLSRLSLAGPPALLIYKPGSRTPQTRLSGLFKEQDVIGAAKHAKMTGARTSQSQSLSAN